MTDKAAKRHLVTVAGPLGLILAVHVFIGIFNPAIIVGGEFAGPDNYMWLNRVLYLVDSGAWFDPTNPRIDPPYGLLQHWTRPFDLLLLLGGALGGLFVDFKNALHSWGVIVSPLLHLGTLAALLWAVSPYFERRSIELLGILFVFQFGLIAGFQLGRPDHQSLLVLVFTIALGYGMRLLLESFSHRNCYAAGLVCALGLWIGMESLLLVALLLSALGLNWLFGSHRKDLARRSFHFSLALWVASTVGLLIESGGHAFAAPLFDRISIVYVVLLGAVATFWAVITGLERRSVAGMSRPVRFLMAIIGVAVILAMTGALFPGFFAGPLASVDDLYARVRLRNIGELKPIWSREFAVTGNWQMPVLHFLFWLGIAVPGLVWLIRMLISRDRNGYRWLWFLVALGVLIYTPLAVHQIRWAAYAEILWLIPYSSLIASLLARIGDRGQVGVARALLRAVVLMVAATWFLWLYPLSDLAANDGGSADGKGKRVCLVRAIAPYLDAPAGWGDRPRRVLTFADFGPELLYRTKHYVFSIPNHRFQQGFADNYRIMTAAEDNAARQLLRERKVDLILICPGPVERRIYAVEGKEGTLHQRLAVGVVPPWLRAVPLPDAVAGGFLLYEVLQ